jgi:hypothetical protein
LAIGQAWSINMAGQIAKSEAFDEIRAVNLVAVDSSDKYRKIIVAIYSISLKLVSRVVITYR